ncbi:hypothetical protein HG537_0F02830 [Torulaspora globosa]|uniref:Nuclear protein localization protein 4 n=1 Tax=Torulaspora globosa TaxID=48254 RepID=A0A7H9HYI5_9SACH|nr:hypothetical protein HG537_0F02830 [Torulaspora sp. CBS 2947]
MIVRFRTRDGMQRISCEENESFGSVIEQLVGKLGGKVDVASLTVGEKQGEVNEPVAGLVDRSIGDLGLKHGDIVYVSYQEKPRKVDNGLGSVAISGSTPEPLNVKELAVDEALEKKDGLIPRKRSSLCKHGDRAMCEYCSPLPPWDKEYHKERNIKHISFHSYLKRLNEHTNKANGSSYIAPLSQCNFKIDKKCRNGHEPWPRGICSKCQPSAITLQQQEFRMVDHVEFQRSDIINEFIQAWRETGTQRFGYMYGTYQEYDATPLGTKAVVEGIFEPAQHDEQDGLTLDVDQVSQEMQKIDSLAEQMGLQRIGLIFTDLSDAGFGDGSVLCKRHKDSFFLSSLEIIMAAKHQVKHPNVSKFSEQGIFSSKFVTCVVSGNLESEIDIASYQVSTSAEALVEADMISGCTHPSMAYINDTTSDRYVPEIFYMKGNEYGLTVKENAKPAFPVDYLLVSLTHGFPKDTTENKPLFTTAAGFPWANRQAMGKSQDYRELKRYLLSAANGNDLNSLHDKISNFQLLLYVHSLEVLSSQEWSLLITAATTKDYDHSILLLTSSPGWQTLVMILQQS